MKASLRLNQTGIRRLSGEKGLGRPTTGRPEKTASHLPIITGAAPTVHVPVISAAHARMWATAFVANALPASTTFATLPGLRLTQIDVRIGNKPRFHLVDSLALRCRVNI